jgi:hypothetical protein
MKAKDGGCVQKWVSGVSIICHRHPPKRKMRKRERRRKGRGRGRRRRKKREMRRGRRGEGEGEEEALATTALLGRKSHAIPCIPSLPLPSLLLVSDVPAFR